MKFFSTLFFACLGITNTGLCQISGTVLDAKEKTPIAGATILMKGTSIGTSSDGEGKFSLPSSVDLSGTLIISFIGYVTQELNVNNRSTIDIELNEDIQALNEIVVTALGVARQSKSLGYVVQTLDTKQISTAQDPNLVNNLAGKIAGVQITNGGAGVGSTSRIVIRGENSFSTSNQPLFVVDGVPINNETIFNNANNNSSTLGTWAEVDWGNGAAEINPNDIEKITVLKGAAAAALYGSRAANGAIVLTTKKADGEKGVFHGTITTDNMWSTPLLIPRIQNSYGAGNGATPYKYTDGTLSTENNIPNYGEPLDGHNVVQFNSPVLDANGNPTGLQASDLEARKQFPGNTVQATPFLSHTDNYKNFLQTGFTTINNISLSTVTDHGSYRISLGDLSNKGVLPNTDLSRYQISLRAETKLTDRLTANYYVGYINSGSNNRPNIGYGSESVMYTFFGVYGMPTNIDLNALKDKWWQTGQEGVKQNRYWANHDNPYVTLFENTNSFKKNRLISNASLKYEFTPNLSLMVRTGLDSYSDHRESHRAFSTVRFPNGGFRTDDVTYLENNTDFLLNYNKSLGANSDWQINVSAGGNRFYQSSYYLRNIATDLISPGLYNFSNARTLLSPLETKTEKEIYSAYAFGEVTFQNWLYLNLTGRNDRSSTLPKGNNSYFYPSASLSAVLSEKWNLPAAFSFLKLRASAAQVGRDASAYAINNTFVTNTPFGSSPLTSANSVLANNNLRPSITQSQEVGIDVRFFQSRLGLDVTLYNSDTKDEVVQVPIPISAGYTNATVNGGDINNKGIEIILSAAPLRSQTGVNWDMTFNFSHNYGTVVSLPNGIDTYKYAEVTQYDRYFRSIQYNAVAGERLGNMYGNVFSRDSKGNIIYNNGVPVVLTGGGHYLGNYNPDFILGWNNRLSYKNFSFSLLWDLRYGGKFYSYTSLGLLQNGMSPETLPRPATIIGQGVKSDGTPNDVAVSSPTYYKGYYSPDNNEAFMYDATYLKLRELRLSYTFQNVLGQLKNSSLMISLIGRNLLLFTKNKDVDPETLALRGTQILPGIEYNSLPSTRSYGFSVSLKY